MCDQDQTLYLLLLFGCSLLCGPIETAAAASSASTGSVFAHNTIKCFAPSHYLQFCTKHHHLILWYSGSHQNLHLYSQFQLTEWKQETMIFLPHRPHWYLCWTKCLSEDHMCSGFCWDTPAVFVHPVPVAETHLKNIRHSCTTCNTQHNAGAYNITSQYTCSTYIHLSY